MIDLYCERLAPGLTAEPVNALTNAAFFIAAWAAWSLARRRGAVNTPIRVLTALLIIIGIGSTLFHTYATAWARALDEIPILIFQLYYLWLYLRRIMHARRGTAAAAIVGYLAIALFARQFPHLYNGSLVYAPAMIAMLSLGLYHFIQNKTGRLLLLAAAGVLAAAVALRSIDAAACPYFPIGTHFLWHILTGVVLYLSLAALILNRKPPKDIKSA